MATLAIAPPTPTPTPVPSQGATGPGRWRKAASLTAVAVLLLLLAATPATARPAGEDPAAESQRIDAWVQARMTARDVPGAAVAVVRDGEVVHAAGYGTADGEGRPVTPDTPFLVGSVSKPFTAAVVGQLVEEGLLAWDEPVWPYLSRIVDDPPDGFETVTVEQLVTHTGGLSMTNGTAGAVQVHEGPDALDRRVAELLSRPMASAPGEAFSYSNAGYMLLAAVVEQVTGRPFAEELRDRVFDPLGMDGSFATGQDARASGMATGHRQWFGRWRPADLPYDDAGVAMGYIGSTASDLARFMRAHLDGHPAIPMTAADIAGGAAPPTGWTTTLDAGYDRGWFVDELAGAQIVSHSGALGHFTAHVIMAPEHGLGVAVLSNASAFVASSHEAQYDLGLGLAHMLLGEEWQPHDPSVLMTYVVPAVAWAMVALLIAAAIRSVVRLRRRGLPVPAGTGALGLVRHVLPGVLLLVVGLGLLSAPLGLARHFYPDGGWAATVLAYLAASWGLARTVLGVVALRRARRARTGDPGHVPPHGPGPQGDRSVRPSRETTRSPYRPHRRLRRVSAEELAMNPTPARPDRQLVARPLGAIGAAVRRAPSAVVLVAVVLTAVLGLLAGQLQEAAGDEAMMPDTPEVAAAEVLAERFGDTGEEIVQVLVRTAGDTLVGADGAAAAAALERAIRSSEAGARIADVDGRPGVVSWLFPAQAALASDRPAEMDDDDVRAAYEAGIAGLPAEEAGLAAGLLADGTGPADADSALLFAFVDATGRGADAGEQLSSTVAAIADAVESAPLPDGVTAAPFSPYLLFDAEGFDAELGRLFTGAFGIIMLILAFVYWVRPSLGLSRARAGRRSAADMLLSMAAIVMAILWMLGLAALLGPGFLGIIGPMNEFTQVVPVLLIGLGVDYAIHLAARYREEIGTGAQVADAARGAIGTVGGALLLATAATAVGFLTNVVNPIPALRDFGVVAAVGIAAAFVVTLTFVPAARLLLDRRAERRGSLPVAALGRGSEGILPGLVGRTAVLATRAPIPTLAVTVVLAGVGVVGMTQLETRFSQTDFVPEGSAVLDTIDELGERFGGGYGETTDVLVSGPVATPEVHNALVAAHAALAGVDGVVLHGDQAAAHSPVTLLAQVLDAAAHDEAVTAAMTTAATEAGLRDDLTVSAGADVAALYAAMAGAAPDLAGQVLAGDGGFRHARVQIQTSAGEGGAGALAEALAGAFAPVEAAGAGTTATSPTITSHAVVTAIEESQVTSLTITLLVAMLLLAAVFAYEQRRPGLGVLVMVPVVLVVLWTFGLMAATGIPFGPITATIAALAIGIGLPYAIHVVHRFTEDRRRHGTVEDAVRSTVRHTGGAMAGSALTTIAGFGILVTSSLLPFRQLGSVMVYAVGLSLVAAVLVLPSILVLWDRWHHRTTASDPVETGRQRVPVGA